MTHRSEEDPMEALKKKSIKFIPEYISESEDELRKKILWQLQDCRFRRVTSSETWEVLVCTNFQLPESVTVPKSISQYKLVILRIEPRGSIETKFSQELKFMLLNNEVSIHHKSTGPVCQNLSVGHRLIVPPNKRFFIYNNDISSSHVLLLLPSSFENIMLPSFLM